MASPQQDLLHVLAREHREHATVFHELMDGVHGHDRGSRARRRQFTTLVLHLGVHAVAEILLVHPLVVVACDHGETLRRERERELLSLLDRLAEAGDALDDRHALPGALRQASQEAAAHADREELEVFTHARHAATPKQLRRMGRLHTTVRQRLATRYQREGRSSAAPWADPELLASLEAWYRDAMPEAEPLPEPVRSRPHGVNAPDPRAPRPAPRAGDDG